MHLLSQIINSGSPHWLSGLWHHQQFRGHPFKKTVVRMPGPSCTEYFMMLKIIPVVKKSPQYLSGSRA
jgi:hypothetical protein